MKRLKSHVLGNWHLADGAFADIVDPCSEEVVAGASTAGIDFEAVLSFAREQGSSALGAMTFAQRGELLMGLSKALHAHRDELIELSLVNTGATRKDAKFDLDGASGTLAFYAYLGKELGDKRTLIDGDGVALGRSAKFWGQHVLRPLSGVAVHINAFNFPAWGFAEKAACALLAGMPVITKPATSSAMVTERCVEILVDSGLLPDGAFQFVCGSTGDLLSRLGSQDVLAFTGSADTALKLRSGENLLATNARVNLEADSLNAAVLGPDLDSDSEAWDLFVREVVREMTQKSGQKCTAVRRIFVPEARLDEIQELLIEGLSSVVVGDPRDGSVNMGPLANTRQLDDAVAGVAKLSAEADIVFGTGARVDGTGAEPKRGYYFGPTLLRAKSADAADEIHRHEVFGPCATLVPYDGEAKTAASLVARANGTLVTSLYSNDLEFIERFVAAGGCYTGRIYLGSEKMAAQAPGSGLALPQSQHGGPGRAGGGAELGGLDGLRLYMQRVALQGSRQMIDRLYGE